MPLAPQGCIISSPPSTLTAMELLPYDKLVLYSVFAGTLTLGRVEMKKKVRISHFIRPRILSFWFNLCRSLRLLPLPIFTSIFEPTCISVTGRGDALPRGARA
jgi:hypothetical protein